MPLNQLTKSSSRTKLGLFGAKRTWFPAMCVALSLDNVALSIVTWIFKLSMSDAEDDGDSPTEIRNFSVTALCYGYILHFGSTGDQFSRKGMGGINKRLWTVNFTQQKKR